MGEKLFIGSDSHGNGLMYELICKGMRKSMMVFDSVTKRKLVEVSQILQWLLI